MLGGDGTWTSSYANDQKRKGHRIGTSEVPICRFLPEEVREVRNVGVYQPETPTGT